MRDQPFVIVNVDEELERLATRYRQAGVPALIC